MPIAGTERRVQWGAKLQRGQSPPRKAGRHERTPRRNRGRWLPQRHLTRAATARHVTVGTPWVATSDAVIPDLETSGFALSEGATPVASVCKHAGRRVIFRAGGASSHFSSHPSKQCGGRWQPPRSSPTQPGTIASQPNRRAAFSSTAMSPGKSATATRAASSRRPTSLVPPRAAPTFRSTMRRARLELEQSSP